MTDQEQGYEGRFHFLRPGCLGSHLDRFAAELVSAGYTSLSVSNYQQSIAHFGTWLQRKRIEISDIDAEVIAAFAIHRCTCPGGRRHKKLSRRYVARVQRFVRYLSRQGLVGVAQKKGKDIHPASVVEFSHWMRRHRGVSPRTIERYARCIVSLLPVTAENALRRVPVSRKNWFFAGSERGGHTAAILFSLMATCKRNRVNPWRWLAHVFEVLPTTERVDYPKQLPSHFTERFPL